MWALSQGFTLDTWSGTSFFPSLTLNVLINEVSELDKISSNCKILWVQICQCWWNRGFIDSVGLKLTGLKEAVVIVILLKGSWVGWLFRYQAEKRTESSLALVTELETFNKQAVQSSDYILRTRCYLLCSRPPGLLEQILPGHRWGGACGQIHGTVLCKRPSWSGWIAGVAGGGGHLAKWSGPAGTAGEWR